MIRSLALLIVLSWSHATSAAERVWVRANHVDQDTQQEYFYFGTIGPAVLEHLCQPGERPAFVKLEDVCFWEYDARDEIVGLRSYADETDSDTLYLNVDTITSLVLLRAPPSDILAEIRDAIP